MDMKYETFRFFHPSSQPTLLSEKPPCGDLRFLLSSTQAAYGYLHTCLSLLAQIHQIACLISLNA